MDKKDLVEYLYKNIDIRNFCVSHKLSNEIIVKNYSTFIKYMDSLESCKNCNGKECKSKSTNYTLKIDLKGDKVVETYYKCPKAQVDDTGSLEVMYYTENEDDIKMTTSRTQLFTTLNRFTDDYFARNFPKGVYLWGKCGTGKSFILLKYARSLVRKGAKVAFAYYPDLVRDIQSSMGTPRFEETILKLKKIDILILDDIGREANTPYMRDEILGPILQYRVDNSLPMFMTSNRDYNLLEKHLSETNSNIDTVKSRAIMERIKFLMKEYCLDDDNFREKK